MILLGVSGRKGAGKNTVCRFLTENGDKLFGDGSEAYSVYRDEDGRGIRFLLRSGKEVRVRTYSMADALKRFCVDVLGLEERQVYGSEADKNTKTRFRWCDMPHYRELIEKARERAQQEVAAERAKAALWERWLGDLTGAWESMAENRAWLTIPAGWMTARQVMQVVGTDIFRRMWGDVWVEACLRQIRKENPDVALVDDVRFPSEIQGLRAAGGRAIRLTRNPFPNDKHASETSLDRYTQFDFVVDNSGDEQCETLKDLTKLIRTQLT